MATQQLTELNVTLGGTLRGDGAVQNGSKTVVTIPLPQGQDAGKTVCVELVASGGML